MDDITPLSGPLLLAFFLSFGLYGVLIIQIYGYFIYFPNDKRHIKILVYTVLAIETAQTALVLHDAIASFGTGFGNPASVAAVRNNWLSIPIVSGTIGCIVQCFYAYRIKVLTRRNTTSYVVVVLAIIQCVGTFVAGIDGLVVGNFTQLNTDLEYAAQVVRNVSSAACDIIIAGNICYYLSTSQPKFERTQTTLTRIIKLIVGSGMFTAILAILDLTLYLALYKQGAYFVIPCICLGKLYSNSMMVVFNNRARIVGGRGRDERDPFGDSGLVQQEIQEIPLDFMGSSQFDS